MDEKGVSQLEEHSLIHLAEVKVVERNSLYVGRYLDPLAYDQYLHVLINGIIYQGHFVQFLIRWP